MFLQKCNANYIAANDIVYKLFFLNRSHFITMNLRCILNF